MLRLKINPILTQIRRSTTGVKISCSSCKYFDKNNSCTKFLSGEPDWKYGTYKYCTIDDCRTDITKCGPNAIYFEYHNHNFDELKAEGFYSIICLGSFFYFFIKL